MPRPNRTAEQRDDLLPVVAKAFAELGFRRATTAELARRCEVRENILYRLWPDKKGMFIAAIEHIYDRSTQFWEQVLIDNGDGRSAAERLLAYEAEHHGEYGMYRIVFAGLSESDDPDIRAALCRMYQRYQSFLVRRLVEHRGDERDESQAELAAWAIIGLGTISAIGRELHLINDADRVRMWESTGRMLLDSPAT